MPYTNKEQKLAAQRRWYARNRKKTSARVRRNERRIKMWFDELRLTLRCVRCGEAHPACLAFHHRDPATKAFTISKGVALGLSTTRLEREMAKCDVLCVNCHRTAHADERAGHAKRTFPARRKGASAYALDS